MPKKVLLVIAQDQFQEIEYQIPKDILEKRGFKTLTASKTADLATGKSGKQVKPDLALKDAKVKDFDALVFIGGPGAAQYFEDQEVYKLARDFSSAGKILAAICIGPTILANAGVLIGNNVTAFPTEEENIKSRGAFYTAMPVEVDGKVVTAKNPDAAKEFGEKIADLLEE